MIIDFIDEMRFDTHARDGSVRDRNLIETCFNEKGLVASGLGGSRFQEVTFLSENPDQLGDRLRLLIQQKRGDNKTQIFYDLSAINDNMLKYKFGNPNHNKKFKNLQSI